MMRSHTTNGCWLSICMSGTSMRCRAGHRWTSWWHQKRLLWCSGFWPQGPYIIIILFLAVKIKRRQDDPMATQNLFRIKLRPLRTDSWIKRIRPICFGGDLSGRLLPAFKLYSRMRDTYLRSVVVCISDMTTLCSGSRPTIGGSIWSNRPGFKYLT